ncbi:MAG: sodium transport system permease protein [Candidatus Paceibacteria bacterium]|jgi:sodium transport system permease protein
MKVQGPPSIWRATWWIARKELLTSFRDRQMAIYAVVLPICMYPVLFWIMIQGALLVQGKREHTSVSVGIIAEPGVQVPAGLYDHLNYAPGASELEEGELPLEFVETLRLEDSRNSELAAREARANTEAPVNAVLVLEAQGNEPALIAYDSTDSKSSLARTRLAKRLEHFAEGKREQAAFAAGIDPASLDPVATDERNLAPDEEMGAYVLSLLLPLLLVVMSVMGAFHPAVDLTAGERERGTMETTMILPIPRLAVHQGKILAVSTSAMLATSLNLLALALSASHLLKMLGKGVNLEIEIPFSAFAAIAPLALLFTFSVSAILTGVAALAKSFKEGQALLGPIQLLFLMPAMASILPGLELTTKTAFIPIVNVVLAFRALLQGQALPLEYTLTAVSLLAYAVLAIVFAVRILSRESLGLATDTIPLRRLFFFLRSQKSTR